ncbi:hypothetical protein IV203_001748 [Nitzschia inconspicua]|uniref:Uncharacterized protein n=1 Tax=Nitzschia inconspicua TaxID=303405 RepID=A0A9K3L8U1_9STRA|nr:hypothetical protein IV203_001748 [Nitzschia inconspicua]
MTEAESVPAPEVTPKEEKAPETPETDKKEETADAAPKKSVFAMMCGCFSGAKKAPAEEKLEETKKEEESTKKEEEPEAEKPKGEDAEASA